MGTARGRAGVLVVAGLMAGAPALARGLTDGEKPAPEPVRIKSVEERATAPRSWLDLGAHGRPGGVSAQALLDAPRFESHIDVEGQAPRDLNETMALWWQHFDLPVPTPYGDANSSSYRPGTQGAPAVNLLPVFGWIKDKIKDRKKD
jgi:hypothetical protein